MTSDRPRLTERAIRDWVDERSFERGTEYHESGEIFDPRREGNTLRARCHGSSGGPYRVEASLDGKGGIVSGFCSCPVGVGCKHIVAMLLLWCEKPKAFKEVKTLRESLKLRSKAELIELIEQMLRREPELEDLLDMPLPKSGKKPDIKPADFKKRADSVFRRLGGEWGASGDIADELEALLKTGDDFLESGNPGAASSIYEGVCRSVLDQEGELNNDEPGHLSRVIVECSEGLGRCLQAEGLPPQRRESILDVLFDVWFFDASSGGTGVGDTASELLLDQTTPAERERLAERVREAGTDTREWTTKCCGHMLLSLTEERLSDEEYLALCREFGLLHERVERLLKLGRVEEAEKQAAGHSDYELLRVADLMVKHHQGKRAEQMIKERCRSSQDRRLIDWLYERAKVRKDRPAMLELSLQRYQMGPSLELYRQVRKLVDSPTEWQKLEKSLIDPLRKQKYSPLLVEILLEEGDLKGALAEVKKEKRVYWLSEPMSLKVAAACEQERPRDALAIYREEADSQIQQQGRRSYETACTYLKKVRALYERLDEKPVWDRLIADIRAKNRRLPALQQELNRAKL